MMRPATKIKNSFNALHFVQIKITICNVDVLTD